VSSGSDGRSIYVEYVNDDHFIYDPKINFVFCCISSIYNINSQFYWKGHVTTTFFTTNCLKNEMHFNQGASECVVEGCNDLLELNSDYYLDGYVILLDTNATVAAVGTVDLGDNNVGIESPTNVSPRYISASSSLDILFKIGKGVVRVDNVVFRLKSNLNFFTIYSSGGITLNNCTIELDFFVTNVKKSFIETVDGAGESVIYIKDTLILDYISTSTLITIRNASMLYLSNVLFDNTNVENTKAGVSAFLIDSSNIPSNFFKIEIRNSNFVNGSIQHSQSESKGYIDVSSSCVDSLRSISLLVTTSVFENIEVDNKVLGGGLINVRNFIRVDITKSFFYNSGGANHGGVFYFESCERVEISECIFNETYVSVPHTSPEFYAEGGAIYGVLENKNSILIKNSEFKHSKATEGRGGAVYLEFKEEMGDSTTHPQIGSYEFNTLVFCDNEASKGTNIFIVGYNLSELIKPEYFIGLDIVLIPASRTVEFFGYDRSFGQLFPLIIFLDDLLDYGDDFNLVFVSGNTFECDDLFDFEGQQAEACQSLEDAILNNALDTLGVKIRILDSTEMNSCINVVNHLIITPITSSGYALLTVGPNGYFYVQSVYFDSSRTKFFNSNNGNLTLNNTKVEYPYDPSVPSHAMVVIMSGSATFGGCFFGQGGTLSTEQILSTMYIADIYGSGQLIMEDCVISYVGFRSSGVINSYNESVLKLKV
jgi:hypothetical protein